MFYKFLTLLALAALLISCAGQRSGSTEESPLKDAPEWFLNPPQESDMIYGVGSALKQNPSLARKASIARARDEVSQAIEVQISSMLRDFMQESGVGDNAEALEFTEAVTRQVAATSLRGCVVKEVVVGKDGTFYSLVEYSLVDVRQAMLEEAINQEALYNRTQARRSFDELEDAIRQLD